MSEKKKKKEDFFYIFLWLSFLADPGQALIMPWCQKEGGAPLCPLDFDPSSMSFSLKVLVQGTNEPLDRERSIPCYPGEMTGPGFSSFFIYLNGNIYFVAL